MDTRSAQFQEALNELYVALMKVIRLANDGQVSREQQLQFIISALSGMTGMQSSQTDLHPSEKTETLESFNQIDEGKAQTINKTPTADQKEVKEYGYSSAPEIRDSDGKVGFRKKYIETSIGDSDNLCFRILYYEDEESAGFELLDEHSTIDAWNENPDMIPEGTLNVLRPSKKIKGIKVNHSGKLEKDGKYWIVTSPCNVELEYE